MINVQSKYTLSELASKLGVSTPWVNKVHHQIGVGSYIGKHGKRLYFNDDDLHVFKNIRLLRMLDYSFSEIKTIYGIEMKMLSCKAINCSYRAKDPASSYLYVLHPYNFTYDEHAVPGKKLQEYDMEIEDYKKWCDFIFETSMLIFDRAAKVSDDFKNFTISIVKNTEAGRILVKKAHP